MLQAQPARRLWTVIEWFATLGSEELKRKSSAIALLYMIRIAGYLAILRNA